MQKFVQNLNIFTFISQYILSLLIGSSILQIQISMAEIPDHQTISNFSVYQRVSYHMGQKVFNSLPTNVL
jgi:hypothetical protein